MPFYDTPSRRTPHDVKKSVRLAFWSAWAVLYLFLPTRLYNGGALELVWRLDHTPWWDSFHPNAFAWAPMLQIWINLAHLFGFAKNPGQEMYFLQAVNGLIALVLLASVYRWMRLLGARTSVAFSITGFVGANFTLWHWGTDVDPYVLMTLFGTWAVWCAWSYATLWHKDRLYWSAVFLSLALLIHLSAIVLLIPIWYVIWSRQEHPTRRKLMAWAAHLVIGCVLVGGPYLYVSEVLYKGRPNGGLVNFVRSGWEQEASWGGAEKTVDELPWFQSMALGHFNLAFWADHDALYYTYRTGEEGGPALFSGTFMGQVLPYIWLINTMLAVIALFPTVSMLRAGEPGRNLGMFLLWTIPSFIIIGLINPTFGYLRLIYLPPMALLVGLWITLNPQTRKRPVQALVLLMMAWNLSKGIVPNSVWGRVPEYEQAIAWRWAMGHNDVIIVPEQYDYFTRQVRVFTGADRILDADPPRMVYQPPGLSDLDFMLLSGPGLDTVFKRVYLSSELDQRLTAAGEITIDVTRFPDEKPAEIHLVRQSWDVEKSLDGKYFRIVLNELAPSQRDREPYRAGPE